MTLIADILLVAGALGAAFYCLILSRRLKRFNDLEKGVGGAVAVLAVQVEDMTKTLEQARIAAGHSTSSLEGLTGKAEDAAKRLELLVAAMHDIPDPAVPNKPATNPPPEVAEMEPEVKEAAIVKDLKPETEASSEALFLRHRDRLVEAAE